MGLTAHAAMTLHFLQAQEETFERYNAGTLATTVQQETSEKYVFLLLFTPSMRFNAVHAITI